MNRSIELKFEPSKQVLNTAAARGGLEMTFSWLRVDMAEVDATVCDIAPISAFNKRKTTPKNQF